MGAGGGTRAGSLLRLRLEGRESLGELGTSAFRAVRGLVGKRSRKEVEAVTTPGADVFVDRHGGAYLAGGWVTTWSIKPYFCASSADMKLSRSVSRKMALRVCPEWEARMPLSVCFMR